MVFIKGVITIFVKTLSQTMQPKHFTVTAEELKDECMRLKYIELLDHAEIFPSSDNWSYIIARRFSGMGHLLYRKYLVASMTSSDIRSEFHHAALTNFPLYLKSIDRSEAIATVYGDVTSDSRAFVDLVYECQLFDSESISRLIDDGYLDLAVSVLFAFQPEYDGDAVDAMTFLLGRFDRLPQMGEMQTRRNFFKTEEVYICPKGHANPSDCEYCNKPGCGLDRFGLTREQRDIIAQFRARIDVLRSMLD